MSFRSSIKRELEVAFDKRSQSAGFRFVKYLVISFIIAFFWKSKWLWPVFGVLFALSLCLHFWYRYKTAGWTKSYGAWKHESERI